MSLALLQRYVEKNFRLVFWPQIGDMKGPHEEGWPQQVYTLADYHEGYRVGVLLGVEHAPGKFLHDVDIDWGPGAQIAIRLLPKSDFTFGRPSKRISHCFYSLPEALPTFKYCDIGIDDDHPNGVSLIELRGVKKDGTLGHQTMVPPSIWADKENRKEPLVFVSDQDPTHLETADTLKQDVCWSAIGMILAKHLGTNGFGHEPRMAWAGFLIHAGVPEEALELMGYGISDVCNNLERNDIPTVIKSTAERYKAGKKVTGGPTLAKFLGKNGKLVIARINEWLGRNAKLVLHPEDPMPSARAFVEQFHFVDDLQALYHQSGLFYAYQSETSSYHDHDEPTVRADLYKFLESAQRWVNRSKEEGPKLVSFQPTRAKVGDVLDSLRAICNLPVTFTWPRWLQDDPGLNPLDILACKNGLLHIPTRELLPATPAFYTLNGLDFAYDPNAPEPTRWLQFLLELWPKDVESIAALQEFIGYLLTPDTRFQKVGMIVGPKRSGKGTIGRVVRRLLGERNVCAPTLANMSQQHGLAVLIGKTAAIIADARITSRTDTGIITEHLLSISGEDSQTIPRKYVDDWNGTLSVRFFLLTNELPRIEDASGALASRFVLLALTESFYGREIHNLFEQFIPELPGILNWALVGRDRLYKQGRFTQPESSVELIAQFENLSSPIGAFLRDRCEVGPGYTVAESDLFTAWTVWCGVNGRTNSGTTQTFGKSLRAAVPGLKETRPTIMGNRVRCYEGVRVIPTEGLEHLTQADLKLR